MGAFERLQERLDEVLRANVPGSVVDHVVVALPSYSMSDTLLAHYGPRLATLEHRFLLGALQTGRIPGAHVVLVTSEDPGEDVLDYYARLASPGASEEARSRLSCLVVDDRGSRGVAAKLLDRPDLLAALRDEIGGRPALIEPWNVTDDEVAVALALDAPVNGPTPAMWPLGFKSRSRRLFQEAGVPVPCGVEDVRDAPGVAAAVALLRRSRPDLDRVVVKVDNSGSGDGNLVLATRADGAPIAEPVLAAEALRDASGWFLRDLGAGGVVEELVDGGHVTSPSAQVDLLPGGGVHLLATHEQVLGGKGGQEFLGSRFPADPGYAPELARHVTVVGELLARAGAVGRVAVDFVAAEQGDRWALHAVDLNLRKGGTTHPFAALRHLVPGHYDAERGRWVADVGGGPRCYRSGDAVRDPAWFGMDPARAIEAVARAGLGFDHVEGVGVVLHMLSALGLDGRVGVTAIGRTAEEADRLAAAVPDALHAAHA